MDVQDLRTLLEQTDDKLRILANPKTLSEYDMTIKDFTSLIRDFLSDEEIFRLFDFSYFIESKGGLKSNIIGLISDEKILLQILSNDNILNGLDSYQIGNIILKIGDRAKKQLLYNQDFMEKHQISNNEIKKIFSSLRDEERLEILGDKEFTTNKLHLKDYHIAEFIKGLPHEEDRIKLLEEYGFGKRLKIDIIKTLNSNKKLSILFEDSSFNRFDKIRILKSLDSEALSQFLVDYKEFCSKNDIKPYEIVMGLNVEQQKDFVSKLEDLDLTLDEKREILATLKEETKRDVDTTNFPEEFKTALTIQTTETGTIVDIDFSRKLEDYQGLDNLIRVNPEQFTEEQRNQFIKLCDICPNQKVVSTLNNSVQYYSTVQEYKEAEEWITSIINKLNPEYSKAQKMAVIDNEIGKRISYSPDFDTEVFDAEECRALWKIISSGYGVCNGIARVEQYIFSRVNIESELIGSGRHAFLKIKDIEFPLANGETIRGNTILDPTWNLTSHRFGAKPDNFCINYEQARKNDIDDEGKDHNSHKNDEELQDATLGLDEQSLRELFKSVGLARKDGKFPITDLLERSKQIDELYANQPDRNIKEQFMLLKQACPEFATCQNSSMGILSGILLNNENLKFNKCVVNRVYERKDEEKRPVLYVYIDSNELGQKFYFASKDGEFLETLQEEFTKNFECYDEDLAKNNRI